LAKKITKARLQRLSLLQLKALLVLIQMLIAGKSKGKSSKRKGKHKDGLKLLGEITGVRNHKALKRRIKGKVPPQLRPYLFKKGHKPPKKKHKKGKKKG